MSLVTPVSSFRWLTKYKNTYNINTSKYYDHIYNIYDLHHPVLFDLENNRQYQERPLLLP